MSTKRRIAKIGELDKKDRPCYVVLRRSAGFDAEGRLKLVDVELPLHHPLSTEEREVIDGFYQDPLPPRRENPITGHPYLDSTDEEWRAKVRDADTAGKRRIARVVRMLGGAQFGVADVDAPLSNPSRLKEGLETAAAILRQIEGITGADLESIDLQGRNPNEVTEEGIAAKEQALSPGTPAPPSA